MAALKIVEASVAAFLIPVVPTYHSTYSSLNLNISPHPQSDLLYFQIPPGNY